MISILVRVEHGAQALASTLSALVPAVADGLVGDAVILTDREDIALSEIAEAMGATLLIQPPGPADWKDGARHARHDWVLCLADGDILSEGWMRAIERFIGPDLSHQRFGRLGRANRSWGERLRRLLRPRDIHSGDLIHRSLFVDDFSRRPTRISAKIERDPIFD